MMRMFNAMRSIALLDEADSESLDSLVELSGVLGHAVLHLDLRVEGADDEELAGLDDAGAALFLSEARYTFLR